MESKIKSNCCGEVSLEDACFFFNPAQPFDTRCWCEHVESCHSTNFEWPNPETHRWRKKRLDYEKKRQINPSLRIIRQRKIT